MLVDRVPPHNIELEEAVLGCALVDNNVAVDVAHRLEESDFYAGSNKEIFSAIFSIVSGGSLVDPIIVRDAVGEDTRHFVGHCMAVASLPYQVPDEIIQLKKMADSRKVIGICNGIEIAAYNMESDDIVAEAITELVNIDTAGERKEYSVLELIDNRLNSAKEPEDFYTMDGFPSVHMFGGDYVVIGGRPAAGKTALALQFATKVAKEVPVMFYSYEMTEQQITDRIIAANSTHSVSQIEEGLTEEDINLITGFMNEDVLASQLFIKRSAGMTNAELFSDMYRFKARGGKVVVIDYLQLAADKSRGSGNGNITQDTTLFSNKLRRVALDTGLLVIAVAQLNRGAVDRSAVQLPILSDLRESGAIEQDATHVLLLMAVPNPKYSPQGEAFINSITTVSMNYNHEMLDARTGDPDDDRTFVTADFAKVRQGKRCRWPFIFDGSKMTFTPIERLNQVRLTQKPYEGRLELDD